MEQWEQSGGWSGLWVNGRRVMSTAVAALRRSVVMRI